MNQREMRKLLIADDSEINRDILHSIFEDKFIIEEAENGQEAIEILDAHAEEFSVILLDIIMPNKTGFDVLAHLKRLDLMDSIPVIVITGSDTEESNLRAYEYGAADIIHKPFSVRVVTRRVYNIVEQYESRHDMERTLEERSHALVESQKKLEQNNEFLINALSSVVEFRSLESGQHVRRVKMFTQIMMHVWRAMHPELGISNHDIEQMVNASALHDIGKIAIPDKILLKPGRLTREEFDVMKTHTTLGCQILEKFKQDDNDFYRYCYDICRYHHERCDGNGYPDGLKGDEIPIWAQVVSVADVYDALISPRVYKDPYPVDEAFAMIEHGECGAFSEELLKCLAFARNEIVEKTSLILDT